MSASLRIAPTELTGSSPPIMQLRQQLAALATSAQSVLIVGPVGSGKSLAAELLIADSANRDAAPTLDGATATPEQIRQALARLHTVKPGRDVVCDRDRAMIVHIDRAEALAAPLHARLVAAVAAEALPDRRCAGRMVIEWGGDGGCERTRALIAAGAAVVSVPPLATRREEIAELITQFGIDDPSAPCFDAAALAYLARQAWPGNVRQLRATVARATTAFRGRTVSEAQAAILLHGERRAVETWLGAAAAPAPLPDRRRPLPIVAAAEVAEVATLLDGLVGGRPSSLTVIAGVPARRVTFWRRSNRGAYSAEVTPNGQQGAF